MNTDSKKIKSEQEISSFVSKAFSISVILFAISIFFAFFAAISVNQFDQYVDDFFFGLLLIISFSLFFSTNADMKFVQPEKMLEMSNEVEIFPEIKEDFCEIMAVRSLLTASEYNAMSSRIKEAKQKRDASIWALKKKSICS